jgi:hypothetical protein
VVGASTVERASTTIRCVHAARSAWGMRWLATLADVLDAGMQSLAARLAEIVGGQLALLIMLPVVLMLRPMLALARAVQHSWVPRVVCLTVLAAGIVAGPFVGTRAGLVLIPLYVLGWTCTLTSLRAYEAADLARTRLVSAGRRLRKKLVILPPARVTEDRSN